MWQRVTTPRARSPARRNKMVVTVRFYGNFRRLINTAEVGLEVADGATPLDLVNSLVERLGEKLRPALLADKEGRLQAGVRIALGDEILDCASDLKQPLVRLAKGSETPIRLFMFTSLMGGR